MAFNFSATTNKNYLQTINPNAPDAGSALKVLSLNLPSFLGGSPIAPDGLLRPGLSTNAEVGGTPSAPPTAAPSAALTGLAAQFGSPAPDTGPSGGTPLAAASAPSSPTAAPLSPTAQSPFATSSAPIAGLASSILGSPPAPFQAAPSAPIFETGLPTGPSRDVYGGGPAPGDAAGQLVDLLTSLFGSGGAGSDDRAEQRI